MRMAKAIGLILFTLPVLTHAIPTEAGNRKVTLPLPAGFQEVPVSNVAPDALPGQLFLLRGSNAAAPSAWFSIRRLSDRPSNTVQWHSPASDLKVVGRYSERMGNLDLDILDSESTTNNTLLRQRSIQFSLASDRFLLDLRSPTLQTNEMDAIMKQVVKTLASQKNATTPEELEGWRNAIICLVMVAMIFVFAVARR